MSRRCLENKELLRQQLAEKHRAKREGFKKILKDQEATFEEKLEASAKLTQMKRDGSRCRQSNRCRVCGRAHGVFSRRFKLCRLCIRLMARGAMLPGLVKSSW